MSDQLIPVNELSYEQAFAELESIVATLESEEQTLANAMDQFERGQALARHCTNMLDKAELKVQQISSEGELSDFEAA